MTLSMCPLGIGDAFSRRHYSSCLLVETQAVRLLVDCPHPLRKMLYEADPKLDLQDIDGVVLTHLHPDHASGLELFGYHMHHQLGVRPRLIAAAPVAVQLVAAIPNVERDFAIEVVAAGTEHQVGDLSLDWRPTRHMVPTAAWRLWSAETSLGISADTPFDPELIGWLAEADVVVHEVGHPPHHTPLADLAALPAELVARLWLIHVADDVQLAGSGLSALEQGRRYAVGTRSPP